MMFTFRQLRYFHALAETGHFGEAADKVGISQPALSVQIAEMEKTVGAALFERTSKRIILTPFGRKFLPQILDILERMTALGDIISDNEKPLNYPLKLGIIPTVAPYLLPILLPSLASAYPDLSLEIQETKTDNLADMLRNGNLDVVIAAAPFPLEDVETFNLMRDNFYLAVSPNDPRQVRITIPEAEIDGEKLLLLEEGHCLRDQTLQVCRTKNYRHDISASSLTTLLQLVANGIGTTVIPQIAISTENKNGIVKVIPFENPSPFRNIQLIWRKRSKRSYDYQLLAGTLQEIAAPLMQASQKYMV